VTLVGKGVAFDSGGLDIKPSSGMLLMKKDMGGAAAALALARLVMETKLDVRLRVLVPIVENAISAASMRPGDVLRSRKGLSVEIGNTDAEGRLILADALALADEEAPELVFDFATLTGAARVALGPDLPPYYTDDEALAAEIASAAARVADPLWRMPLWRPYETMLESRSPISTMPAAAASPARWRRRCSSRASSSRPRPGRISTSTPGTPSRAPTRRRAATCRRRAPSSRCWKRATGAERRRRPGIRRRRRRRRPAPRRPRPRARRRRNRSPRRSRRRR
jgi:hypothetical protein